MDLPRVLHVCEPEMWQSGRAAALLRANGRTLAAVIGAGPGKGELPALSRHVPLGAASLWLQAVVARAMGAKIVHAHSPSQVERAAGIARRAGLPWSVSAPNAQAVPHRVQPSFVLVDEKEPGSAAHVPVVCHGLGDSPEPGALMAVLESHWLSVLRTGQPAAIELPPRALPTVTVLLATYQRRALLRRCLDHLEAQTYPSELVQVIVVDNGSTDGTAEDLRSLDGNGRVTVVTTGEALLVTEARNRGLGVATGELVVFTDDDCRPVPTWLESLVGAWLVGGRGIAQGRTTGDPQQPRLPSSRTQETPFGYGLFETCNIAYPRTALGARPFDDAVPERLRDVLGRRFPADPTGEDTDLGWRLREQGLAFCFSGTALVHHEIFQPDPAYLLRRARMTAVFPILVQRHPELRRAFLVGRVFLHKQRPLWWLAVLAPVAALAIGPGGLAAAAPYLWDGLRPTRPGAKGRLRALPLAVRVEVLTTISLLRASARTRRLVL